MDVVGTIKCIQTLHCYSFSTALVIGAKLPNYEAAQDAAQIRPRDGTLTSYCGHFLDAKAFLMKTPSWGR